MIKISAILCLIMTIVNLLLYFFTRDVAFLFFGTWTLLGAYNSLGTSCTVHVILGKDGKLHSANDNQEDDERDSDRD